MNIAKLRDKVLGAKWRVTSLLGRFYLKFHGVVVGDDVKILGWVSLYRGQGDGVAVGNRVVFSSDNNANPINKSDFLKLALLSSEATISIGDDSGVSSCVIAAKNSVTIGCRVLIGAGVKIMDTDFHLIEPYDRRYNRQRKEIPTSPVTIGDDVWLGAGAMILKGVTIGNGSIIAAGAIVTSDIPPGVIAGGTPARVIKHIDIK